MRVVVEVIGRPLVLPGGARYNAGERLLLDPMNPQHAEVLARGWVRRIDALPAASALQEQSVTAQPPAHKMVESAPARKASTKKRR